MKKLLILCLVFMAGEAQSSLDHVRDLIERSDLVAAKTVIQKVIAEKPEDPATAHMLHGTICIGQNNLNDAAASFTSAAEYGNPMGVYYAVIIQLMAAQEEGDVILDKDAAIQALREARVILESVENAEWKCTMIDDLIASIKQESVDRAQTSAEDAVKCSWCRGLLRTKVKHPDSYHEYEIWRPWLSHAQSRICVTADVLMADYLFDKYNLLAWLIGSDAPNREVEGDAFYHDMQHVLMLAHCLQQEGVSYGYTLEGLIRYTYLRKRFPIEVESSPYMPDGYDQVQSFFTRAEKSALEYGETEPYATLWRLKLVYEYGGKKGFEKEELEVLAKQGIGEASIFLQQVKQDQTIPVKQSRPWWQRFLARWSKR